MRTRSNKLRGHTLVELVVAMASATLLMAGLGSAVVVSSKAFRPETTAAHTRGDAAFAQRQLLADLRLAKGFTERTDKAATFTVPDRDGDGLPDTLRYAWSGTSGDPLTFAYNGGADIALLGDVRGFTLSYVTQPVAAVNLPPEQTGSPIVLLVNNSQGLTANEAARKAQFETWNFQVSVVGLNDGTSAILNAASLAQALYVCSSINDSSFSGVNQVKALTVGLVNEHPQLNDDFGFATSTTTNSLVSQVGIINNTHHITTGQTTGTTSVGTILQMYSLGGTLATNLNTLATVGTGSAGAPALVTVDTGKLLTGGQTAAGRRVMIPWAGSNVDPAAWNAAGKTLTQRAIEWATGVGDASPEFKKVGYETIFATADGAADYQYATRATLADNARLQSMTAYVGGVVAQVRLAIYSDVNGEPGSLIAQSSAGATSVGMSWITLPLPQTDVSPGNYWLALAFNNSQLRFRYTTGQTGAGARGRSQAAVANGFIGSWGASSLSVSGVAGSIYGTYQKLP